MSPPPPPLVLVGANRPVIGIDRLAMYPIDSNPDAAIDLSVPFGIVANFPAPRALQPNIIETKTGGVIATSGRVIATNGMGLYASTALSWASELRSQLDDLTDDTTGGFSDLYDGPALTTEQKAVRVSSVNNMVDGLYGALTGTQGASKMRDSSIAFVSNVETGAAATNMANNLAAIRNDMAEALYNLYVGTGPLKTSLDNATKAVFFDSKFDSGLSFKTEAVLPNVLGRFTGGSTGTYSWENELMTGLLFNKGTGTTIPDKSDLQLFYDNMCSSDDVTQKATSNSLTVAEQISAQRATFAALSQASKDFVDTYEQVVAWETSTGSSSAGDTARVLVPGSAFLETRSAARARSACRVLALYGHVFDGVVFEGASEGSATVSTMSPNTREFNKGFGFDLDNGVNSTLQRYAFVAGTYTVYSGVLHSLSNIVLQWNITPDNLALRQLYYLRSTSAEGLTVPGVRFVPVSVTITQSV